MPWGRDTDDTEGADEPRLTFGDRMRKALLKPEDPGKPAPANRPVPDTVEEIEDSLKRADDKERLIGLAAAPLALAIGLIVFDNARSKYHWSNSTYSELDLVVFGLSLLMLAMAWWRRRLFLALAIVLFAVTIIQLGFQYVGFAIPFVFAAAWLLVRTYRLQQGLREAKGGSSAGGSRRAWGQGSRPTQSKRYTPPSPRRPTRPKAEGEQ